MALPRLLALSQNQRVSPPWVGNGYSHLCFSHTFRLLPLLPQKFNRTGGDWWLKPDNAIQVDVVDDDARHPPHL